MKKIFLILILVLSSIAFVSCGEKNSKIETEEDILLAIQNAIDNEDFQKAYELNNELIIKYKWYNGKKDDIIKAEIKYVIFNENTETAYKKICYLINEGKLYDGHDNHDLKEIMDMINLSENKELLEKMQVKNIEFFKYHIAHPGMSSTIKERNDKIRIETGQQWKGNSMLPDDFDVDKYIKEYNKSLD